MPTIEIDVGSLPTEARAVVLDYREASDPTGTFVKLGETADPVSRWNVPGPSPILVRARVRDRNGRVWPGREETFTPTTEVSDRPDATAITPPAATVVQDGPALEIVQKAPEGSAPEEFVVEAVQTETADSSPKNGLHLGYHAPGDPIPAHVWPDDQKIWTRLVRKADERRTDWISQTVESALPLVDATLGHSNDFASGTIAKLGGAVAGQDPLEISGGDLRHKALYIGDADGYIGDANYFIGDAGLYWSPATYTTANVTLPANEHLQFQFHPKLTSVTRPSLYIGDANFYIGGPPRIDVDGTPYDNRLRRLNLTNGADEIPLDMDVLVATSETSAPTFVDADFVPLVPGKVYRNVLVYACRVVIRSWHHVRVTIDELRFWHWTWCKMRPWHTHSDAYELLYDYTAGSDLADLTATVALATYDDVRIEVQWKNADANPSQLFLRLNNDTGANYYKDGAGADTSILVGGGTIAASWWEHAVIRIVNPKSGAERGLRVESTARWNATTSAAPGDEATVMWDNTANAITSIVFDATVGANPLGTGSRFRIWGKRHHEE